MIVSDWTLRHLNLPLDDKMLGSPVQVRTLTLDFNPLSLIKAVFSSGDMGLPIGRRDYQFKITGISEKSGMGGVHTHAE